MTRTLSVESTICGVCENHYDTVEEAIECEILDMAEEEAALREQEHWEADDDYLTSLHGINFSRP